MRRSRAARIGILTAAVLLVAGLVGLVGFARTWVADTQLPSLTPATSAEVLDADGRLLRAFTVEDGRWRLSADPERVDPHLIEMLIAYEDKRFYSHHGVDPLAMLRAIAQAVRHGEIISGGSTLTMQVARLLEDSGTGSWRGKLRQIRVALALEAQLSKADILSLYLTLAPYGGNIEGVRAAARIWFDKEPDRLTPAQAALLVVLPQSPESRRPDRHPEAAKAARAAALTRFVRAGIITKDDADAALHEPLPRNRHAFPALAPHLTARLHHESPDTPVLRTTINAPLQAALEPLAQQALAGRDPQSSVAIIVADHQTGAVLATVGSGGWDRPGGFVDMTRALRSPGSTLKPLIYALAFDDGLAHPETLIDDRPTAFGSYAPQNFDGMYRGELRVSEALQLSLNIPAVALTEALGPARLIAALRQSGAQTALPNSDAPGLAVALGGLGMTLEGLTQVYMTLARGGTPIPLHYLAEDTPREGREVVRAASAWQVGHILAGLMPPAGQPLGKIAYKTGTSYGHRDTWALGFDGRYTVGVWLGRPDGTPIPGAFGADVAAPLLFDVFQRIAPQSTPLSPPPSDVLLVENAALPAPLKRFRPRGATFAPHADAPKLTFPPDGATLLLDSAPLTLRLRDGAPPFTVLLDGRPVIIGARRREVTLPPLATGFATISVVDSTGRSDRVRIGVTPTP
ncbi:penicillin-binding protein 1C [Celeribacter sp.]|uniref:penicillin-binding protein 1C n=1 Tax=Celeribacter sp. TaxID=1890673 RepID=UPI003A9164D4